MNVALGIDTVFSGRVSWSFAHHLGNTYLEGSFVKKGTEGGKGQANAKTQRGGQINKRLPKKARIVSRTVAPYASHGKRTSAASGPQPVLRPSGTRVRILSCWGRRPAKDPAPCAVLAPDELTKLLLFITGDTSSIFFVILLCVFEQYCSVE